MTASAAFEIEPWSVTIRDFSDDAYLEYDAVRIIGYSGYSAPPAEQALEIT